MYTSLHNKFIANTFWHKNRKIRATDLQETADLFLKYLKLIT